MKVTPTLATRLHRHRGLLVVFAAASAMTLQSAVRGAPPDTPKGAASANPPAPDAARPAATTNRAAPSVQQVPASRPVSGGGSAPHGAQPMTQQLAQMQKLVPSVSANAAPAGIEPSYWKSIIPADNAMTETRVALGRRLYFEPRLSKDGTVACATCHDVSRGFTDRRGTSEGIGDKLGQRNSPTTLNAALFQTQFWDGRAITLEDQAQLPIVNPIEMGMPNGEAAIAGIKNDAEYVAAFKAAYGRPVNFADTARAIAAFERTLIFLDAPFDRFVAGNLTAINDDAKAGWVLYNGKGRCNSCHQISSSSPIGTDNRFHNIGVAARSRNFEELAKKGLQALAKDSSQDAIDRLALQTDLSELGRFVVTRNRSDIGSFKTSQVRNVGVTAPYMHDGSMQTLWDVMDHYNKGGESNPYLDGGIEPLALTEKEVNQLVAFLFTLTDVRLAQDNQAEFERQRLIAAKRRPFRDEQAANRRVLTFEQRRK
jgi:cytochrome c peroxidase